MERVKKNFGFGFMRLPMRDGEVDIPETKQMDVRNISRFRICLRR